VLEPGSKKRQGLDEVWGLKAWVRKSFEYKDIPAKAQFVFVDGTDVLATVDL
jgi:hypothetical protein